MADDFGLPPIDFAGAFNNLAARPRQVWSNYHITIQPHLPNAPRTEHVRLLNRALTRLLNRRWTWLRIVDNGATRAFNPNERNLVDSIRARPSLEAGADGAIHMHIVLEVMHHTSVQVDYMEVRDAVRSVLPQANCNTRYLNYDGADREFLLRYVLKDGAPAALGQQIAPVTVVNPDRRNARYPYFTNNGRIIQADDDIN